MSVPEPRMLLQYAALLRGINVSGRNIIPMEGLRELFAGLGFRNISTYIQSGNVICSSPGSSPVAGAAAISQAILAQFRLQVPVILLSATELYHVAENNPFLSAAGSDESNLHVTFLAAAPAADAIEQWNGFTTGSDTCIISGNAVYLNVPGGYGRTKLNNTWIEQKLKVPATTRNWKTVLKLAAMLQAAS